MDVRASYSRFTSDFEVVETESRFLTGIQEATLQADLERRPTGRTRWKSGLAAKRLEYDNSFRAGGTVFNESAGRGWETAVYSQINWDPNSRWLVEGGVRVDHWRPDPGGSETTVSPRFAVKRFIRDRNAAVRLAGGRYSQFLHSLRDEEFPFGIDVWVLAGARAPRVVSDQLQLGVESFFADDEWFASQEGVLPDLRRGDHGQRRRGPQRRPRRPRHRRGLVVRCRPVPEAGCRDDHGVDRGLLSQDPADLSGHPVGPRTTSRPELSARHSTGVSISTWYFAAHWAGGGWRPACARTSAPGFRTHPYSVSSTYTAAGWWKGSSTSTTAPPWRWVRATGHAIRRATASTCPSGNRSKRTGDW